MATSVVSNTLDAGPQSSRPSVTHRVPSSPRTPLINRSISGAFGSPSSYSREQEDIIVYELDPRYFSAGFAGEHRPRCIWHFGYGPNEGARVGDYGPSRNDRPRTRMDDHVLYKADLREIDLELMRAKFERVVRTVHLEQLQLDQKQSRKAALVVSPLTPTRLLELVVNVLFSHYTQPPSITLLTRPVMSCVSAGVRDGLVIDIGWEETTVTAVAEYRTVLERRSIRGGKMLTEAYKKLLENSASSSSKQSQLVSFALAEEVRNRYAWVKSKQATATASTTAQVRSIVVPLEDKSGLKVSHESLSDCVRQVFFDSAAESPQEHLDDDHELAVQLLVYNVLRRLPGDLRSSCASRIIVDGHYSRMPGLRSCMLEHLQDIIDRRGWETIDDFGSVSATQMKAPALGSAHAAANEQSASAENSTPRRVAYLPARDKPHDDVKDLVSQKAEREMMRRRKTPFTGKIRGVESLGAWTGASMVMSFNVKGTCEVEREDFLKHGLRSSASLLI